MKFITNCEPRKKYSHDIYQKISHADRIKAIYLNQIHRIPAQELEDRVGIKYNTIRNIIRAYLATGRTNKKSFLFSSKNKLNSDASNKTNQVGRSILA